MSVVVLGAVAVVLATMSVVAVAAYLDVVVDVGFGGAYATYKRATSYFLQWLLRARSGGVGVGLGASKTPPKLSLDVYDQIVDAIAAAPSALAPALLALYPHALEACESAITLRTRVALFLADAADEQHAHFLDRLRQWFQSLKAAYAATLLPETPRKTSKKKTDKTAAKRVDFSNYYDVLALPDDYFADEVNDVDATPTVVVLSAAEQKRLFDQAFAEDMNAELAYLFMELEELSEAVYAAYYDVKREKKSLVEATAVAKVAIDCAASVIAKLQLSYPSIQSAEDLCALIQDRMPLAELGSLVSRVEHAWMPSDEQTETRYQYVPGTIVVDFLWVGRAIIYFGALCKRLSNVKLNSSTSIFGDRYDEDETPEYTVPDWKFMSPFFMQPMAAIHNLLIDMERNGVSVQELPMLEMWFLARFDRLRQTGTVTLEQLFVCICWVRSVAALQGNRGLGRAMSVSLMHRWDLHDRLEKLITSDACPRSTDSTIISEMKGLQAKIQTLEKDTTLHRVSPILTGCVEIDLHVKFLELGNDTLLVAPVFRGFCHVYSALRVCQLIDNIPIVEDVLRVYEAAVFTPSRAGATRGSFKRSYRASEKLVEWSFRSKYVRKTATESTQTAFDRVRLINISKAFRLLYERDYAVLPAEVSTSSSWGTLMSAVAEILAADLFDSRVLSRDMLQVTNDLNTLFQRLCDEIKSRHIYDKVLATAGSGLRQDLAVGMALEHAVVNPLLPFLDIVTDGEITRVIDDAEANSGGSRGLKAMLCRRAAVAITQHFAQIPMEDVYYVFPSTCAWTSIEFGETVSPDDELDKTEEKEFDILMEMLEESSGPLNADELADFKRRVVATPGVLYMAFVSSDIELSTLLHQVAAGPASDRRLREWLLQLGALEGESSHCRFPEYVEENEAGRQNIMTTHLLCIVLQRRD